MSKRRRKARGRTGGLSLDGPDWMPVAEAHRLLIGSLGNGKLAAKDLTAAVAAKRSDKRLPCMQRAIESEIAPDQDREIVPLSFWDKYEFICDPVIEKLRVCKREAHILTPVGLAGEDPAFFVWKPKFEKIWPALAASAPARSSPAGIEAPPPRRRGPATTHDWMSICGEIAARCINPRDGRLVVPVKDSAIVASMRIRFLDKNLAVPATTEMSEAVRRVCAPLREVQRKVPRKVR